MGRILSQQPFGIFGALSILGMLSGALSINETIMSVVHLWSSFTHSIFDATIGHILASFDIAVPKLLKDYVVIAIIFCVAFCRPFEVRQGNCGNLCITIDDAIVMPELRKHLAFYLGKSVLRNLANLRALGKALLWPLVALVSIFSYPPYALQYRVAQARLVDAEAHERSFDRVEQMELFGELTEVRVGRPRSLEEIQQFYRKHRAPAIRARRKLGETVENLYAMAGSLMWVLLAICLSFSFGIFA